MEIDDFKKLWNNTLANDKRSALQKHELDAIVDDAMNNTNRLARTSRRWLIIAAAGIGLTCLLMITTASLYIFFPERLESLSNALPVMFFVPVAVMTIGYTYYRQARILDVSDYQSITVAMRQSISRFRKWYNASIIIYLIVLIPIYYLLALGISYRLALNLSSGAALGISIPLTIVTLILNHVHYSRTYFQWIKGLKRSLDSLGE